MVSHLYSQSDSRDARFHYEMAKDILRYPGRNTYKDDSSAATKSLSHLCGAKVGCTESFLAQHDKET